MLNKCKNSKKLDEINRKPDNIDSTNTYVFGEI